MTEQRALELVKNRLGGDIISCDEDASISKQELPTPFELFGVEIVSGCKDIFFPAIIL